MTQETPLAENERETEHPAPAGKAHPKVVVVMPAYNAGKTLQRTYEELPRDRMSQVIVVDDASTDNTVALARQLGLDVFVHDKNYGYGANQKTCYIEALRAGADIVVMVHPDYQYDPRLLPEMVEPILRGEADIVLGSRLKAHRGTGAVAAGMPWWKWAANRFLTGVENAAFGLHLSEYHTGYRSYTRRVLESCHFQMNSDGFVFDQECIAQAVAADFRIAETPVPVRYFPEASSANFRDSCVYGFQILALVARYLLHRLRLVPSQQFVVHKSRYKRAE